MIMLMHMLQNKLTHTRNDLKHYNGNTISIDINFKKEMLNRFDISIATYQRLITKIVKA